LLRTQQFSMTEFRFEKSFGRVLGVAYHLLFKRLSRYMKEENLPITPDQFRLLTTLWQQDCQSQQELAVASDRDRANVTRLIDILEREQIVERKDHATDRRIYNIHLTEKGKAIEVDAKRCAEACIADALDGLSPEEIETCMKVLRKTIENLK
jgi:DNA-binding MarR family transcriptional regulator